MYLYRHPEPVFEPDRPILLLRLPRERCNQDYRKADKVHFRQSEERLVDRITEEVLVTS
jgi:hypothetical protein